MTNIDLHLGDCLDILPSIPSQSVDAVITDSPYPHIKRDYGIWTTEEWWALMVEGVVPEVRRILKPTGSAVFILQPNSEHVGQMRGWLWEFMAWVCREWNMVQDVWWWNPATLPSGGTSRHIGLMRSSIKPCVWCGLPDCYRDQDAVLWDESNHHNGQKAMARFGRVFYPSGHSMDRGKVFATVRERGGVTPYNFIPVSNQHSNDTAGIHGHGAGTPLKLADWWTRYICPPGGTVVDPFDGVGTMMLAALQNGCNGIGIERDAGYHEIAQRRIDEAQAKMVQSRMAV